MPDACSLRFVTSMDAPHDNVAWLQSQALAQIQGGVVGAVISAARIVARQKTPQANAAILLGTRGHSNLIRMENPPDSSQMGCQRQHRREPVRLALAFNGLRTRFFQTLVHF